MKMIFLIAIFLFISCSSEITDYIRFTVEISDSLITNTSKDEIAQILLQRYDLYGVDNVSIQKISESSLRIDIPIQDYQHNLKKLIEKRGFFELRLLKDPNFTFSIMEKIDKVLADSIKNEDYLNTSGYEEGSNQAQELSEEQFRKQHPFFALVMLDPQSTFADAYVRANERNKLDMIFSRPNVQKVISNNAEFIYSANSIPDNEGEEIYVMYMVNREPELTGDVITDAVATIDPTSSAPVVNIKMNSEGATEWARITGANVDKRIAIMLDGVIYSAPIVRGKISVGRAQIEGFNTLEDVKIVEIILKTGALPSNLKIIDEENIKHK